MPGNSATKEMTIEGYGISRVTELGGRSIKLRGYAGIPDRLHILPGGIIFFVEYKRPVGGKFRPLQLQWLTWLRKAGFHAEMCHTKEAFDQLLDLVLS